MLYCTPELIEAQPKGNFAAHLRGQTKSAVPLAFPFGYMEAMSRMDDAERAVLRSRMRERYAVHFSELENVGVSGEAAPSAAMAETKFDEGTTVQPGHIDTTPGETW